MLSTIYNKEQTVFSFKELMLLIEITDVRYLRQKINYYVKTGKLLNLRRGIYSKLQYNPEELASKIYSPSYISLEYVLRKEGIIFQYSNVISCISYLSREVHVQQHVMMFRKMKSISLVNTAGILRLDNGINIATPERAFLDRLYLEGNVHTDYFTKLNKEKVFQLLPIYNSQSLAKRTKRIFDEA